MKNKQTPVEKFLAAATREYKKNRVLYPFLTAFPAPYEEALMIRSEFGSKSLSGKRSKLPTARMAVSMLEEKQRFLSRSKMWGYGFAPSSLPNKTV